MPPPRVVPDESYEVDPKTGCWNWTRGKIGGGYGSFKIGPEPRRLILAHRFFYERVNGPIPDGHVIHHLCWNRSCVNPDHLEPRSRRDNAREGFRVKLSVEKARAIRARLQEIADEYGIALSTLSGLTRANYWDDRPQS